MRIFQFLFTPNIDGLKQKKDIPGLLKALHYPGKAAVRVDAARAIGALHEASCKPDLYACLDDEDENVRTAAAEALDQMDQPAGMGNRKGARREIRVFISSTFRDMQKERDILIRQVFPFIRQMCRARGIGFTEVDLRWGVTEQQAERGEVLPICMAEIENTRPYFIGLLGERYGWVPGRVDSALVEDRPWLKEHEGASLTELEILHGVLNNPSQMARALFYFRDPAYISRLPAAERSDYVSEDAASEEKLRQLKARIRSSDLLLVEHYPDPASLGGMVQADLAAIVEQDFPTVVLDPLDVEAVDHETFAETRRKVYIRPAEIFQKIHQQVESSEIPLVLTGASGIGKSALLANWVSEYAALHPDTFVLSHFIGATPQSTASISIQSRIMAELKRHFQINNELPAGPEEIKKAFPGWLRMASERGPVVIVLDGLNQLEDRDQAPDLVWLPVRFPTGIKVIFSTLPGRSLEAAQKRGWQVMDIGGLPVRERKRMIYSYLAQYRKRLNNRQVDRIALAEQSSNPLYLKALLDELRIFGIFEKLDNRIDHYLQAETVENLYQRILERLEQDYPYTNSCPDLVKDALSLIWASRDGLAEDELLGLLGSSSGPLPRALWSPLYLSLQDSLVSRSGNLTFFHNHLRDAVQKRYLARAEDQKEVHRRMGAFFATQPTGNRVIRELPWQWQQAEEWSALSDLLAAPNFFSDAWHSSEYELKTYWTAIEKHSGFSSVDAYRPVLDDPDGHVAVVREVSILFADTGHIQEAIALRKFLVDHYRTTGRKDLLVGALNNLAILLNQHGDQQNSILFEQEAEQLCRDGEASIQDQIATLNTKAALLKDAGRLSEALSIWEELANFCRENECNQELSPVLNNIGMVLLTLGKWEEALIRYRESEQISQSCGDTGSLILALAGQANILISRSLYDEGLHLTRKAAQLCRDVGDKLKLVGVLNTQMVLYQSLGKLDLAYPLVLETEQIAGELNDMSGLAGALLMRGVIEQSQRKHSQALTSLRAAEKICREIGDKQLLHSALGNQATILRQQGQPREALALQKEVEELCRNLGDQRGLQTSLGNQANILFDLDDLEGAVDLHRQKVAICREIGFVSGLALGLANQAATLITLGRTQEAIACADEAGEIARQYQMPGILQQIQQIYQMARR